MDAVNWAGVDPREAGHGGVALPAPLHAIRPAQPPEMNCPRCQAATPPGGRFCAQCGAPLPGQDSATRTTRRQMTVLFCDLVGSTDLAQRIDPDDLLAALQRYHDTVRLISARFGGYVARIVGDGVDVHFGYPEANEDDAARALHAALAMAAEVPRIEAAPGEALSLRIGLATGLVAISAGQGIAVAGSTPNLAARVQATMPPGGIGVAPGTRRIAGAQFEFDDLGSQALKGFDAPVAISGLRRALSLDSRSAWRGRDASLPMVGREAELAALLTLWQRASAGRTCGALVLGEAGLGKSRLATALDQALPPQGHTLLRLQCSPFHVNSALQPFVQHLAAAAGHARGDSADEQLDKLEAQLAIAGIDDPRECALIASLLGVPFSERYPPLAMPPPLQLQLTKEALKRYFSGLSQARVATASERTLSNYFVGLAEDRPLLMVFEDMHWVDPTSLELVDLLLSSGDTSPILLLMTGRPVFPSPWRDGENFNQLALQRLPDADATAVAAQQSQRAELPAEWLASIVERSDGVPLFIEEMTRMLIERRDAPAAGGARAVPDTLMDLLTERLDRLPAAARQLAQVAAVIGREFDRELLAAVLPVDGAVLHAGRHGAPPDGLQDGVQAMLDSGLVLTGSADGQRLLFKHALVEDTAYASIPPKRCSELHGRVADALLTRFEDRVAQQPELGARHLTRAGRGLQAASWWQAAGGQALSRGAPREAAGHLRAGVAALQGVPAGPERDAAELGLLSMLGPTTMVLLGPGSAEFGAVPALRPRLRRPQPRAHHGAGGAPVRLPAPVRPGPVHGQPRAGGPDPGVARAIAAVPHHVFAAGVHRAAVRHPVHGGCVRGARRAVGRPGPRPVRARGRPGRRPRLTVCSVGELRCSVALCARRRRPGRPRMRPADPQPSVYAESMASNPVSSARHAGPVDKAGMVFSQVKKRPFSSVKKSVRPAGRSSSWIGTRLDARKSAPDHSERLLRLLTICLSTSLQNSRWRVAETQSGDPMAKRVEVLSEITGNVWKVVATAGQRVEEGEVLVIVESMKMEIPIEAPCAGTLAELSCREGEAIQEGATAGFIEVA